MARDGVGDEGAFQVLGKGSPMDVDMGTGVYVGLCVQGNQWSQEERLVERRDRGTLAPTTRCLSPSPAH